MPAKGRRVASRQAQLGRRRRRQPRAADDPRAVAPGVAVEEPQNKSLPAAAPATEGKAAVQVNESPAVAPARSGRDPAWADRSMAYTHLGAELRRILILAGALLVVLVVLAFAL